MPSSDSGEKKAKPVRAGQTTIKDLEKTLESLDERLNGLSAALEDLRTTAAPPDETGLAARVEALEKRLDVFLTAAPPEFRKLSPETVEAVIKEDPFAEFEVLKPYKFNSLHFKPGQRIRVDRYDDIMSHVRNNLLLGKLANHEAILEEYRKEREAKEALARAAREEARALAAKAALQELEADRSAG